ncbi:hypothetical protein LguiB_026253 [Lonicera macranthoides]
MIYIKDGLRIMVLKGLVMFRVQPGYFGILRRWYNDVGKGHRKWVFDVGKNWDNVLENVRWSYWVSSLVAFGWVWIWIGLVWFGSAGILTAIRAQDGLGWPLGDLS